MPRFGSFSTQRLTGLGLVRNFVFNKIISSNTQNYNLRTDAIAAGWNGITPLMATVTINNGVYVWSDSTATAGFDTGSSFPIGTALSIINNGYIIGKGGNGVLRANGTAGGPAMNISYPVSITNNSYIAGGGGGGGGSNGAANSGTPPQYGVTSGGGGAGGGDVLGDYGSTGGAVGQAGTNGTSLVNYNVGFAGGGGGGRVIPGVGGVGSYYGGVGGTAGGAGGAVSGAFGSASVGGNGGSAGQPGSDGTGGTLGAGAGGGGGWGAAGGNALSNTNYQLKVGGAGGKAVNLNGNTVTWLVNGTRWGAIS